MGRRRAGNRKDRPRLVLHRSKTRLESPWPCGMVPVGGGVRRCLSAKAEGKSSIMDDDDDGEDEEASKQQ